MPAFREDPEVAKGQEQICLVAGSLPSEGVEDQGFGSGREIRANGGGRKRERKGR